MLTSNPDYIPGIDELLDFTHTSIKQMRKADIGEIRKYLEARPGRQNNKSVIVVNTALEYGLGRMMGALMDRDVPVDRWICYSLEEALDWLRPGEAGDLLSVHQNALGSDAP